MTPDPSSPSVPAAATGGLPRLASIRLYVALSVVLVLAMIVGTLLPQTPDETGGRTAGETVYHTWWFAAALTLLALNVIACTVRRFSLRLSRWGFLLTHLGVVLILAGSAVSALRGQRGFIGLHEGQRAAVFTNETDGLAQPLGFELELRDFTLQKTGAPAHQLVFTRADGAPLQRLAVEPDATYAVTGRPYRVSVLAYYPDFRLDLSTKEAFSVSEQPHNPALLLDLQDDERSRRVWLFARHPDQNVNAVLADDLRLRYEHRADAERIRAFLSTLAVRENGRERLTKTIRVNDPLTYKGTTFYQADYRPDDLTWTGLQVARDPGVPWIYTGCVVLVVGLVFVFYIKPFARRGGMEKT